MTRAMTDCETTGSFAQRLGDLIDLLSTLFGHDVVRVFGV